MKEFRELSALGETGELCRLIDELAESGPMATSLILLAMRDRDDEVRCYAVRTLSRISTGQQEVIEALITALKDQSCCVRRYAAAALGVVQPATVARAALLAACSDIDHVVRQFATQALTDMDRAAISTTR